MSADAVPSGARVRPSMRSSVAVADTRFVDVHGEVVLPAAWLCQVANLPNFFLRVFPPTITFLVLPPPLVHPYIVGLDICRCVDLRVGGIASVLGGMVPDVVCNECVDEPEIISNVVYFVGLGNPKVAADVGEPWIMSHMVRDTKGVSVMPTSGNGDGDEDGAGRGSMVKTTCFSSSGDADRDVSPVFSIFFLLLRLFMLKHMPLPLPLHQCLTM